MILLEVLYLFFILLFLCSLFFLDVFIFSLIYSYFSGASLVSSSVAEIKKILNIIPIRKGCVVLELGCGYGNFLIYASKKYQIKGVGVDINPVAIFLANLNKWFLKSDGNISFKRENILNTNLLEADIIYLFLFPKLLEKLKNNLLTKTKNQVIIISHGFKINFMKQYLVKIIEGKKFHTYIYQKNLKKN